MYTYPYFWQHDMGDSTAFTALPLWIASYRSGGPKTPLPGGWKSWTFWQYTSAGSVAGIHGPVDVSLFSGSRAALDALADPTAPAGQASPPPGLLPPLPLHLPHLPARPLRTPRKPTWRPAPKGAISGWRVLSKQWPCGAGRQALAASDVIEGWQSR